MSGENDNIPDFWPNAEPETGERCVSLREPLHGFDVWTGTSCETRMKYICKAGMYIQYFVNESVKT